MEENKVNEAVENKAEDTKTPSIDELMTQVKSLQTQLEKQKEAYNAASSDAANWKRQFRDTQDEATRKEAEKNEAFEALKKKVAEQERQITLSAHKSAFVAMGYPDDLATKKATFLADGDIENAMQVEKDFIAFHDKAISAASVRAMQQPASGFQSDSTITKEKFANMSLRERTELRQKHPEVYAEMTKH